MTHLTKEERTVVKKVLKELIKAGRINRGLCLFGFDLKMGGLITLDEEELFYNIIYSYRGEHVFKPFPIYFFAPGSFEPRVRFLEKILETK